MKIAARRKSASQLASIDDRIMPLINIVFLLLIFFMVAGIIAEPSPIEFEPPESAANMDDNPDTSSLYIAANGDVALVDGLISPDTLDKVLASFVTGEPDQIIRIHADQAVDTTRIIKVMDTLREAGAAQVRLVTRTREISE